MNRRAFLTHSIRRVALVTSLPAFLDAMTARRSSDAVMPVLFVGHGNPMNAIEPNEFHKTWVSLGTRLPRPQAILCVSAHWLTRGTKVTAMERPQTIHDFGGFPEELYQQQYPAPGAPALAEETRRLIGPASVQADVAWGLDHGTWSFLLPMYPQADIPVYQLSIDVTRKEQFHYDLAKALLPLRRKGVLIVGSGNIVHNLGMMQLSGKPYDWAVEFDEKIAALVLSGNHAPIINYEGFGRVARLAVPTNDHYLPLMYPLALKEPTDDIAFFNEATDLGSVSMRSIIFGRR